MAKMTTVKHWIIGETGDTDGQMYTSYADAEEAAKQRVGSGTYSRKQNQFVFEAVSLVKNPVPTNLNVIKL